MKSDLYNFFEQTRNAWGWPQTIVIDDAKANSEAIKSFLNYYMQDDCKAHNGLEILDVIFNYPATIVKWSDGDKTVVKCDKEDRFDERVGFLLCVLKKYYNNNIKFYSDLDKWIYHPKTKDKKTKTRPKKQTKKVSEKTSRDDIKDRLGLLF